MIGEYSTSDQKVNIVKTLPRAVGNNIIIKAERPQKQQIVIANTETYQEKMNWLAEKLTVVSVGEKVELNISVGQRVFIVMAGAMFNEYNEFTGEDPEKVKYFAVEEKNIRVVL